MRKIHKHKRKSLSLFQSDYIQLQSVMSSITSWKHTVQAVPSKKKKSFRKKKGKGERKKGKRWKKGEEEKGMERERGKMRCEKKDENEGEGERRGRERRIKNRRGGAKECAAPSGCIP